MEHEIESAIQEINKRGRSDVGSGSPELGSIVRKYRQSAGLSLRGVSHSSELHHGFIGRIESGERGISVESLARLGIVFGDEFVAEYMNAVIERVKAERSDPNSGPSDQSEEPSGESAD